MQVDVNTTANMILLLSFQQLECESEGERGTGRGREREKEIYIQYKESKRKLSDVFAGRRVRLNTCMRTRRGGAL